MSILLDAGPVLNFLAAGQQNIFIKVAASHAHQVAAPEGRPEALGELVRPDERAAELRETLHAYLECGRSLTAATDRLGLHRNTGHYRVQQALAACADDADTFTLLAALTAAAWAALREVGRTHAGAGLRKRGAVAGRRRRGSAHLAPLGRRAAGGSGHGGRARRRRRNWRRESPWSRP